VCVCVCVCVCVYLSLSLSVCVSTEGPDWYGTWYIWMSSQFLCWARSQRRAVMSILRQMSMSTFMAFSWILLSSSDRFCGRDIVSPSVTHRVNGETSVGGGSFMVYGCEIKTDLSDFCIHLCSHNHLYVCTLHKPSDTDGCCWGLPFYSMSELYTG